MQQSADGDIRKSAGVLSSGDLFLKRGIFTLQPWIPVSNFRVVDILSDKKAPLSMLGPQVI